MSNHVRIACDSRSRQALSRPYPPLVGSANTHSFSQHTEDDRLLRSLRKWASVSNNLIVREDGQEPMFASSPEQSGPEKVSTAHLNQSYRLESQLGHIRVVLQNALDHDFHAVCMSTYLHCLVRPGDVPDW